MDYIGIADKQDFLKHYGRIGMKWYQHLFGNDPRWGKSGRAKNAPKKVSQRTVSAKKKAYDKATASYKSTKASTKDVKEAYKRAKARVRATRIIRYERGLESYLMIPRSQQKLNKVYRKVAKANYKVAKGQKKVSKQQLKSAKTAYKSVMKDVKKYNRYQNKKK